MLLRSLKIKFCWSKQQGTSCFDQTYEIENWTSWEIKLNASWAADRRYCFDKKTKWSYLWTVECYKRIFRERKGPLKPTKYDKIIEKHKHIAKNNEKSRKTLDLSLFESHIAKHFSRNCIMYKKVKRITRFFIKKSQNAGKSNRRAKFRNRR